MSGTSVSMPVNLRLDGRLCVLVGGGKVALRKGRKLLEHGSRIRVIAPELAPEWHALARDERVTLVPRAVRPDDLDGAFLVVAATDDARLNRDVASWAREARTWVLVADAPELGDLTFPATLRQGDLTVSFATEGALPALAAKLKEQAVRQFGEAYAAFCDLARTLREGEARALPVPRREQFFKALVNSSALDMLAEGRPDAARQHALDLLEQFRHGPPHSACARTEDPVREAGCAPCGTTGGTLRPPREEGPRNPSLDRAPGRVFLLGAGPGDPGLLTVKATDCLRRSDAVLYDSMVNPAILEQHCEGTERFDVGKRKGCCRKRQDETTALMIDLARQGRTVARLKGGDPMIFGRGGEEARALRRAGIDFEIVPGVSCVSAAPAYAGIPVTDRDFGSSLGIYTVHTRGGLSLSDDRWRSIAQGPDTLIFLMGRTRCADLVEKLMEFGRPPGTPMALICDGTLPGQARTIGTLESFRDGSPDDVPDTELRSDGDAVADPAAPGMIVVGEVVRAIPLMDWFQPARHRDGGEEASHGADPVLRGR